jgi:hypothetical protein
VVFEANTAWGTPLFGREVGGHAPEGLAGRLFILVNLPSAIAGMTFYTLLQMAPVSVAVLSSVAGLITLTVSGIQWFAIGILVRRIVGHGAFA